MQNHGFNHIGLATRDVDRTIAFYRDILGFTVVRYDKIEIEEGGHVRHVFLDCGGNQTISFVGPEGVPGVADWKTGINEGLGVPKGFYHFAFHAESEEELIKRQQSLIGHGIPVTHVVDHDWCKGIYFIEPVNGLSLEFCAYAREFNDDDRILSSRFKSPWAGFDYDASAYITQEKSRFEVLDSRRAEKELTES